MAVTLNTALTPALERVEVPGSLLRDRELTMGNINTTVVLRHSEYAISARGHAGGVSPGSASAGQVHGQVASHDVVPLIV
jgi:hypothetical protein